MRKYEQKPTLRFGAELGEDGTAHEWTSACQSPRGSEFSATSIWTHSSGTDFAGVYSGST